MSTNTITASLLSPQPGTRPTIGESLGFALHNADLGYGLLRLIVCHNLLTKPLLMRLLAGEIGKTYVTAELQIRTQTS